MGYKVVKELLFYTVAVTASIFLLFFFITSVWIGNEAKRICQEAKWEYGKSDCVEALAVTLDDEHQGFRTRNHAIWAMGQYGDSRSLPVLKRHYTGIIPEREPLDRTVSQYELKKAIGLIEDGQNITAWVWRWGME